MGERITLISGISLCELSITEMSDSIRLISRLSKNELLSTYEAMPSFESSSVMISELYLTEFSSMTISFFIIGRIAPVALSNTSIPLFKSSFILFAV